MRLPWVAALLGLALLPGPTPADVPVSPLERRLTDLTGSLTKAEVDALEASLADFERRKGSQIAVLIVPTTQPETIEQYSIRVAESWKLGRKGVDDGVLLLVAKNDRTVRIEVGYGLEGVLTDATSNQIIEDIIVPRFKAGDFAGGINAGVAAIIQVVEGEPLPPAQQWRSPAKGRDVFDAIIPLAMVALVAGAILRAVIGRLPAATLVSLLVGALVWAIAASLAIALFAAVAAFLLTLLGQTPMSGRGYRGGGARGGGWGSGGGGGGFGGGGGGFGGGGASGRW